MKVRVNNIIKERDLFETTSVSLIKLRCLERQSLNKTSLPGERQVQDLSSQTESWGNYHPSSWTEKAGKIPGGDKKNNRMSFCL